MKFLLATNSKGKLAEYRRLAEGSGLEFTTAAEEGFTAPDPEETGSTFAENARIKKEIIDLVSCTLNLPSNRIYVGN